MLEYYDLANQPIPQMQTNTSTTKKILKGTFGVLAIVLAIAAIVYGPGFDKYLKDGDFTVLQGSVGTYIQEIEVEAADTENVFVTTSGVELKESGSGYEMDRRIESADIIADNAFISVGFRWHESKPVGTTIDLSYRVGLEDDWTDWREITSSEDVYIKDDPGALASDLLFITQSDRLQVAIDLTTDDAVNTPRLDDLRIDFINSLEGPSAVVAESSPAPISANATTVGQPNIISRAGWGANESWMDWTPQHADVKQLIVHHTAGSDGGNDPAAVVRGIYYYHAVTLGWGDIGYNYLIDAQGRIYTGRAGGEGVIAGHTLGFNTGSVGVALLGTYDSQAATPAAEAALADLAGYLSARHNLTPTSTHTFGGKTAYMLAGHRDFTSTLCPGTLEHSRLGSIRTAANNAKGNYLSGNYAGTLSSIAGNILAENRGGTATIKIKNTGSKTWYRTGTNKVIVRTVNPLNHKSSLHTSGWVNNSVPSYMSESSVAPGKYATFKVPLAASKAGNTSDSFALVKNGSKIAGTSFTLTRSSRKAYAGKVVSLPSVINIEGGTRTQITVKVKNVGYKTWKNSGANFAALNLIDPLGRTSQFRDADWPTHYRPTKMDSSSVGPDGVASFKFNIKVPSKQGNYYEAMQPVIEGVTFIPGASFKLHLRVANGYQSQVTERPLVLYGEPNQEIPVTIDIINKSSFAWEPTGTKAVSLKGVSANATSLKAADWVSANTVALVSSKINPGQSASMSFKVKVPDSYGEHSESFQLVSGTKPIDGSKFNLKIIARRDYEAKVLSKTPTIKLKAGTTGRAEIKIKNTGSKTWYATGNEAIKVYTSNNWKHDSDFSTTTWNNSKSPTNLEPAVVAPNQVATLSIEIAAGPTAGDKTEYFGLADLDGLPIAFSGFGIKRSVSGSGSTGPAGNSIIRAGIYSTTNAIGVKGNGSFEVKDKAGKKLGSSNGAKVSAKWNGSKYVVTGAVSGSSTEPIRFVPSGSTILELADFEDRPAWNPSLNDNKFRGTLEVRRSSANGKTYAINHVKLEHFVKGVAEASNGDNAEYYKALAIAVRTYTEYQRSIGGKHSQHGFDVQNTDLVYKGYNLEKRNTDFVAAANATAGKFVTYNGSIVVTPFFSQSDGRTRGFHEAFGGPVKPWLVSVNVPEDNGKSLLGHGVGLSASGARAKAAAGKKYSQILKAFYTGITIIDLY